jgi:chromosome segregation ATPase
MEPPGVIKSAPSALLLSEIEILLAQAQLMELYLKQDRAAASTQAAQLQHHYQSELKSLRTELGQKARALAAIRQEWGAREERLQGRFQQLKAEIAEKQCIIDRCESKRSQVDTEIDSLRARIRQLESANENSAARAQEAERARDSLRNELAALSDLLREKSGDLEQRQKAARQFERELNDQIRQLERRLAENRTLLEAKDTDLQRANAEIAQLTERCAVLEASRAEAHANAARELEQTRTAFEPRLAELQTALGEKDRALNACHAAMAEIQSGVEVQIHDLKNQLDQKQTLLESRDGELAELGARLAECQARIGGLEQANQEALAAANEFAAARQNYETEIQEHRSQLRRNQEILEENQAAARALEEARQAEIRELKNRLDQEHELLETGEHELRDARSQIARLQQQILKLEATAGEAQQVAQHQLEQTVVGFEAEIAELRELLAQKEQALQERVATISEIDGDLRAQIGDLESQLAHRQIVLASRDGELAELRSELDAKERSLEDQRASLAALDAEHRTESEALEARLVQSRDLIASKDSELERVRSEHAALRDQAEERHAAEIAVLSVRLSEGQSLLDRRASELQQAHSEIAAMREQAVQSELLQKQTERLLSAQAEQIRDRVSSELAAVEACLKQKERELQTEQDGAAESQLRLHGKIERLQIELAENRLLLAERDHEISDLKEQSRNLPERLAQLESFNQQAQADAAAALERNREVQQAELTALREELRTKVEALAEQQISANGLEAKLLAQGTDLQEQLADARGLLKSQEESLNAAQMEFSARLEQKDQAVGAIQSRAADLEATLNSKIGELQTRLVDEEARANDLQRSQEAQRTELQDQLAATQRQLKERQQALDSANAAAGALQEHVARLEASNREAQAVTHETIRKGEALESALADLRKELQIKESALAERQGTIENLAQVHKNEIQTLDAKPAELRRAEAEPIPQPLERRTEKPLRVKAATDSLRERLGRPEKASPAAEGRAQDRASLTVPGQSAVNTLASEQVAPDNRKENAFVPGDPKVSASYKERFNNLKDLVEKVQTEESPAFPARVRWGWRYFGKWKRRQKT